MPKDKTASRSLRLSRRKLLVTGGTGLVCSLPIPFLSRLPVGITPLVYAANAHEHDIDSLAKQRPGLSILSDRPINIETPPHLLDDAVTPAHRMFVRNNGLVPAYTDDQIANWRLVIDGEVDEPLSLTIADLKRDFEVVSYQLQIECAGNGRRFVKPAARGNQWSFGAISCATWTGVRLRDVLDRARPKPSAVYTAHYGADPHLSGDREKLPLSRGVPLAKAMEPHTLIAFQMNGEDIPLLNGYPLRLIAPGWPGSCSHKWLTRINLRDRVHDGPGMTGQSYRVPANPVAPGTDVPDEQMAIIESLPVKSLITAPQTGARFALNAQAIVNGHAWAGDLAVASVETSIDFGTTWQAATLDPPVNKYSWQHWRTPLQFAQTGYYEVWARARDSYGHEQPPIAPGWNPRGYLNNMQHRIAVFVT